MWNFVGGLLQPVLRAGGSVVPKMKKHPISLPTPLEPQPDTPKETIDSELERLKESAASWTGLPANARADLLQKCMWNFVDCAGDMAALSVKYKGSYGSGLGEELTALVPIVVGLAEYVQTLRARGRQPAMSERVAPSGHPVFQVFPRGIQGALFPGFVGEVWCTPGKPTTQGSLYTQPPPATAPKPGKVALVLGAGNQLSVVVMDILHKLVAEDEVVMAKMSPVNDYQTALLAKAMEPLRPYVAFACGGPEVGKYLVQHPLVESIHLTGSHHTFNAIVWGSPTAPRKGTPPLNKPVTAELGNITPFIVVPGPWSADDLQWHAKSIVAGLAQNAGHNCIKAEVLVTCKDWPLRAAFMEAVRAEMAAAPQRCAYYPGSAAKFAAFKAAHAAHEVLELGVPPPAGTVAQRGCSASPWLLVEGLSPGEAQISAENWCGVLQEVALPGKDAAEFLKQAASFVNEQCWGTLAAAVWIHPRTQAEVGQQAWQLWLAGLRYGCITVNCPTSMGFVFAGLPWGAAPGGTLEDIGSGIGLVHNTSMYDTAEKGVLSAPWRFSPKPLWFLDHTSTQELVPPILKFVASQGSGSMAGALKHLTVAAARALQG